MCRSAFFIFCAIFCGSSAWAADNPPKKQSQERAAKKACATSDYRTGIDILAELYVETDNPTYVYNQGRCYEQNSRFEQAIERFREYLRTAVNLPTKERAEVEKHIADCESFLPKPAPVVAPAPFTPPNALSSPATPLAEPPSEKPDLVSAPSPESGSGLRAAGYVAAGVGVAALVTAVVLNMKHENLAKQQDTHFSRSRESSMSTYRTLSWIGYGVGAAAVLTGGTLWLLGRRSPKGDELSLALLPVFDLHGAGCLLRGGF